MGEGGQTYQGEAVMVMAYFTVCRTTPRRDDAIPQFPKRTFLNTFTSISLVKGTSVSRNTYPGSLPRPDPSPYYIFRMRLVILVWQVFSVCFETCESFNDSRGRGDVTIPSSGM